MPQERAGDQEELPKEGGGRLSFSFRKDVDMTIVTMSGVTDPGALLESPRSMRKKCEIRERLRRRTWPRRGKRLNRFANLNRENVADYYSLEVVAARMASKGETRNT